MPDSGPGMVPLWDEWIKILCKSYALVPGAQEVEPDELSGQAVSTSRGKSGKGGSGGVGSGVLAEDR